MSLSLRPEEAGHLDNYRAFVRSRVVRWSPSPGACARYGHQYAPADPHGTTELFCCVCGEETTAEQAKTFEPGKEVCNSFYDAEGRTVSRRVLSGQFTDEQLRIAGKTAGRCWYCGTMLSPGNIHIEHQTPLSRGGRGKRGNRVASCRACNLTKGDMTLDEYRSRVQVDRHWRWHEQQRQFLMYLGWLWLQAIGGSMVEYVPWRFYGEMAESAACEGDAS